ncbi:MAG: CoA transferase [Dehalococcoidales bacterium]|nr:CoA transferase [Dehalococcoidales bacterium]
MAGILEGVKVLEMGHVVVVPAAAATMGDWGADVLKVEPLTGDMARGFKSIEKVSPYIRKNGAEISWYFTYLNRNKRSIALNLKSPAGREVFDKLIMTYDVFMSNYQVSSLERMNLDYATLSKINPRLIYSIVTGYGSKGPDKDERGFDHTAAWARSGIQHALAEPGVPPPMERGGMMDRVTGAHELSGIMAALYYREKTGKGQALEVSLYHAAVWTVSEDIQAALLGTPLPQKDRTKAENPLFNYYRTKEGRYFQLAMLQSDVQWPGFCQAIGRTEWQNDPRFKDMDIRGVNSRELIKMLDEIFITKTRPEWEQLFKTNDCIYGRIEKPDEVVQDPQAFANDFFGEVQHPAIGPIKLVNTPVRFTQNPGSLRLPAPEVGQHTEEVLLEFGYNWDDIGKLKEQGVIL